MRKMRLALVVLSPLLGWGPAPVKVALNLLILTHLSAWFYGIFAPNSPLFGPVLRRGRGPEKKVALTLTTVILPT